MGMFDSVFVECTECSEPVEFQSKAGVCEMKRYHVSSVPLKVAVDLDGETARCSFCNHEMAIVPETRIDRVRMVASTPRMTRPDGDWD